jgi:hypothetical protein
MFDLLTFNVDTGKFYWGGEHTTPGKKFTNGSINYVIRMSGKMPASSIANVIHRSEKSVRRLAEKMGISLKVN